jgi:hypothetical protein
LIDRSVKDSLRWGLFSALLLLAQSKLAVGQTDAARDTNANLSILCVIRVEQKDWSATKPAIVYVTVENLSSSPLEVPLWSHLSLTPVSPGDSPLFRPKDVAMLGASVDPTVIDRLVEPSSTVIRDVKGDGSIRLRFAHKGEKANLKFDARDLIWDFEAANRTPAFKLFSVAKSGAYDLQFHMSWGTGACESEKVGLTIGTGKPQKEK